VTPILVVAALTLVASFVCSLLEAALYAITPARLELLRQEGGAAARKLVAMREDVEAPIAAILTVNTIAHTVGSAWCGAMVGEAYGSSAVGVFAAVFTFLVLAVTEIVPKSLGVRYAPALATSIAWPIQIMIWSVWPIVWVSRHAMRLLMGDADHNGPSEDELVAMSSLAARGGGVRGEEHRWVENALRLDQVTAGDLRTPRTVVERLPADMPLHEAVALGHRWVHSRVPITEDGQADKVTGLVYRREVFDTALAEPDAALILRDLERPLTFVPETLQAHALLDRFLTERVHMMGVADEYGGFEGVVTLEDVLEALLGAEIVDEHDEVEDMQALALQRSRQRLGIGDAGAGDDAGA
jgi:CBS domain containing-hemolysin-like protein